MAAQSALGDLHPCLALAGALRGRGHAVTVATHPAHRARVEAVGVGFAPLRPDFWPDLHDRMFNPRHGTEFTFSILAAPAIRDSYADLLVASPAAFAVPLVAER